MVDAWIPTYITVHHRVQQVRGKARLRRCVTCGERADHWAYDHEDPEEIRESRPNGRYVVYSIDIRHYDPLCSSCHSRSQWERKKSEDPRPKLTTVW